MSTGSKGPTDAASAGTSPSCEDSPPSSSPERPLREKTLNVKTRVSAMLHTIYAEAGAALWDLRDYLDEPLAPEDEIESWPLWASEDCGGIWCGDDECPLGAESSQIGSFAGGSFTLVELRQAVGEHIAKRREREADGD